MESEAKLAPDATPRLNAALAKAQGMMEAAKKDSKNPAFLRDGKPSTYADLASVIAAVREAFAANEIAYPQTTLNDVNGVTVFTHLRHSSGESLVSPFWVPVVKKDPQGYGSATTYARRFGLMAAAGIAPEDDDGNEHSTPVRKQPAPSKPAAPKPVDTSKLVAAFAGLGVSPQQLAEHIGRPLAEATEEDVAALREFHKHKKELATLDPDAEARRIEQEKAEAGIAAEKLGAAPVKADVVDRTRVFAGFVDQIRAAKTPEELILIGAKFGAAGLLPADAKALGRTYTDRLLVLSDAVKEAKRPKVQIQDLSQ